MTTATSIQENADDILAEAKEINRQRADGAFEDESEEMVSETAEEVE